MDLLPQSKLEMIPDLLEREDCDVWIILSREHNYDLWELISGFIPSETMPWRLIQTAEGLR